MVVIIIIFFLSASHKYIKGYATVVPTKSDSDDMLCFQLLNQTYHLS